MTKASINVECMKKVSIAGYTVVLEQWSKDDVKAYCVGVYSPKSLWLDGYKNLISNQSNDFYTCTRIDKNFNFVYKQFDNIIDQIVFNFSFNEADSYPYFVAPAYGDDNYPNSEGNNTFRDIVGESDTATASTFEFTKMYVESLITITSINIDNSNTTFDLALKNGTVYHVIYDGYWFGTNGRNLFDELWMQFTKIDNDGNNGHSYAEAAIDLIKEAIE